MRERILTRFANLSIAHPRLVLALALALTAMAAIPIGNLEVSASRFDLIEGTDGDGARAARLRARYGVGADLVGVITSDDEDRGHAAADELARRLEEELGGDVRGVVHRVDLSALGSRSLLSLDLDTLDALAEAARGPAPRGLADVFEESRRHLEGVPEETLDTLATELAREPDAPPRNPAADLRRLRGLSDELARFIDDPTADTLALGPPAGAGIDAQGYLASDDGRTHFVMVSPSVPTDRYEVIAPLTRHARRIGREVATEHGVEIGFTGYPAIAVDEIDAIRIGSVVTGAFALILVLGLFAIRFRSLGGFVAAALPLAIGTTWAFAFIGIAIGKLSLLTQMAAPVFAGLGIDFAIHLLSAYDRGRAKGRDHADAVAASMRGAGKGVLTGALTTAGGFLALSIARYEAFRELGLAAGVGILLVMAAVLLIVPALLTVYEQLGWRWLRVSGASEAEVESPATRLIERIAALATRRPLVLGIVIGLTALLAPGIARVAFDANVEALLPADAPSVVTGRRMLSSSVYSNEHLATEVDSLDEARVLSNRLAEAPHVGRVESAALLVPTDQEQKLSILRAASRAPTPRRRQGPGPELASALEGFAHAAEDSQIELRAAGAVALADDMEATGESARRARERLRRPGAAARARAFDAAFTTRFAELRARIHRFDPYAGPIDASELPPAIRRRLVHEEPDGALTYAVYAYPRGDVFRDGALTAFNAEVRAIAPDAVGAPMAFASFVHRMEADAADAAFLALGMIALILWLDFKNLRDAALSLAPVLLAAVWSLGAMGWLGIHANLANVAALPLILGIGVDDGVHLIHRTRRDGNARVALRAVIGALTLTTATTIFGFGAIGLAPHRGMQSFAIVMVIGATSCLLATLLSIPALLTPAAGSSAEPEQTDHEP